MALAAAEERAPRHRAAPERARGRARPERRRRRSSAGRSRPRPPAHARAEALGAPDPGRAALRPTRCAPRSTGASAACTGSSNSEQGVSRSALTGAWLDARHERHRGPRTPRRAPPAARRVPARLRRVRAARLDAVNSLEREVDIAEGTYMEMLHSLNLARMRQQSIARAANLDVVAPPQRPGAAATRRSGRCSSRSPLWPGSCSASAACSAVEILDQSMRTPERAAEVSGLPLAGAYPTAPADRRRSCKPLDAQFLRNVAPRAPRAQRRGAAARRRRQRPGRRGRRLRRRPPRRALRRAWPDRPLPRARTPRAARRPTRSTTSSPRPSARTTSRRRPLHSRPTSPSSNCRPSSTRRCPVGAARPRRRDAARRPRQPLVDHRRRAHRRGAGARRAATRRTSSSPAPSPSVSKGSSARSRKRRGRLRQLVKRVARFEFSR